MESILEADAFDGLRTANKAEGFLLMISTLVWFIATLRILFRAYDCPVFMPVPAG